MSALGEKDEALKAPAAALSRGNWWPSRSLLEEEALKPLQKTEGFAAIYQEMPAQTRAKPELFLIPPKWTTQLRPVCQTLVVAMS